MPIITKTITHKFNRNRFVINNMKQNNLQYPLNTDVEMPLVDFKLISPRDITHPIECECDMCHKKFTKTILRTDIENIKNNTITCKECNRKKTNQQKFGVDYPFYDLEKQKMVEERRKNKKDS